MALSYRENSRISCRKLGSRLGWVCFGGRAGSQLIIMRMVILLTAGMAIFVDTYYLYGRWNKFCADLIDLADLEAALG